MPPYPAFESSTVTENIQFPAGEHLLHGELAYPETGRAKGVIVFAGPHPLLGGNMRNNVVRCLSDGLAQKGFMTLRFDYRGVGRSEGPRIDIAEHVAEFWQTSHVSHEMDFWQDVQGAVAFVEQISPGQSLALVGYSFGCALLPHVRPNQDLKGIVLIAPTVAKHDYDTFYSVTSPLLVIASEDDFATEGPRLDEWFNKLRMPGRLVRKQYDNHFFRGHEDWLTETVFQFLTAVEGHDE